MVTAELSASDHDRVEALESRVDRPTTYSLSRSTHMSVGVQAVEDRAYGDPRGRIELYATREQVGDVVMAWLEDVLDAGWTPTEPEDAEALGKRLVEAAQRAQAEIEPAPVLDPRD